MTRISARCFTLSVAGSRSNAGPGAASGRRRPSRDCAESEPAFLTAQTLAAAGHYPGPDRGRLRIDSVGVFSSGRLIGQIHFGVGCDLLIRCLPALSHASESPGPDRFCPRALARTDTGRNWARPSHPSHSVRVVPAPEPPARAGKGHGPGHPIRRTRWSHLPMCRLHPPQPGPARREDSSTQSFTHWSESVDVRPSYARALVNII